jgi:hypothetical protein
MFENAIKGSPGQEKDTYSYRHVPLGTLMTFADGRAYRFVYNGGTAGAAGKVVQPAALTSNHVDCAVAVAGAAGDTTLKVTLGATAISEDEYRDGYAVVEDGTGEGHVYAIGKHAAVASAGTFTIPIDGTLTEAVATSDSKVSLFRSPYRGVVIQPSPPTLPALGVWQTDLAASTYGWIQVKGVCAVLQDGAVTAGKSVMPSDSVDGAVEAFVLTEGTPNTEIYRPVGVVLRNAADTEHATVLVDFNG